MSVNPSRTNVRRYCLTVVILLCVSLAFTASPQAGINPTGRSVRGGLDDTGGFIHLSPGVVYTNNGCSEFSLSVVATLTDARNFSLRFLLDSANLDLLSISPGTDPRLHVLPTLITADTLHVDGFFHPNFPAGSVTLATLRFKAISPADTTTSVGFLDGQGWSGLGDNPQPIDFTGDTATVIIDGTPPRPPDSLIIIPLPYPALDDSIRLQWRHVTRDMHNNPVVNPRYTVYLRDVINSQTYTVASILDTFLYDNFIHYTFPFPDTTIVNIGTYEVRACKTQP